MPATRHNKINFFFFFFFFFKKKKLKLSFKLFFFNRSTGTLRGRDDNISYTGVVNGYPQRRAVEGTPPAVGAWSRSKTDLGGLETREASANPSDYDAFGVEVDLRRNQYVIASHKRPPRM